MIEETEVEGEGGLLRSVRNPAAVPYYSTVLRLFLKGGSARLGKDAAFLSSAVDIALWL